MLVLVVLRDKLEQGAAGSADIKALVQGIREFFTKPVKRRWKGDSRGEQPDRLVYLLDHEYTQRGLQWNRLKSVDAQRAVALRAVAAEHDCKIFLALADVHETWACEEEDSGYSHYGGRVFGDYDEADEEDEEGDEGALDQSPDLNLTEFIERDVELRHWLGLGGRWEAVAAPVDDSELCFTKPSAELEPFESEHEGYMGNYGNTVEHWYHRAAVVLWPRERTFVIRAKASPQWGIAEIAKALRARNSAAAVGMAQRLTPFWSHLAGRTEKPALFAATLNVAAKLKDATIAATLLQPWRGPATAPLSASATGFGLRSRRSRSHLYLRRANAWPLLDQTESRTPDWDTPRISPEAYHRRLAPIHSRKRAHIQTFRYCGSPNEQGIHQYDQKRADETRQSSWTRSIQQ